MTGYDTTALLAWRAERDEEFRTHYASPIPEEHRAAFGGLHYFDPDPGLAVSGPLTREVGRMQIVFSTGRVNTYRIAGRAHLDLGGRERSLIVLHGEEDDLFIPFHDATCGVDSYGGGRYVGVERSGPDEVSVDFNRATNPLCAYDEEFSCPLPPAENWLDFPVRAGERDYRAPRT